MEDWNAAGWALPIILMNYGIFLAIWLYFVVVLTTADMTTKFLSLATDDLTQICEEIPRQVNMRVQADIFGAWSTKSTYQGNASAFEIEFSGSNITTQQFKTTMEGFKDQLQALSAKASKRDAGWNAMVWTSFSFKNVESQMMFYSTADINTVYTSSIQMGVLTSAQGGMCDNYRQIGYYDSSLGLLKYVVPTPYVESSTLGGFFVPNLTRSDPIYEADYIHAAWEDACPDQFRALAWEGWSTSPYTNQLELSYDIRTAVTAMSLNIGMIKFDSLLSTTPAYGPSASGGLPGTWWIDPLYAPMEPIFCVDKQKLRDQHILPLTNVQINGNPLCFVVKQTKQIPLFYYPFTISMYIDSNLSIWHCECPRDAETPGCNERNYLVGLFYDQDRENATKSLEFALGLQKFTNQNPQDGDLEQQEFLYPFFASVWQISPPSGPAFVDVPSPNNASVLAGDYHAQQWKRICPWGTCGAVVFSSYNNPTISAFLPLNDFNFQSRDSPINNLTYGDPPKKRDMCTNTIFNGEALTLMIENAPSPLVQPYYECRKRTFAAFQDAAGNAAGIADGLSGAALFILGAIFFRIQNWRASRQRINQPSPQDENGFNKPKIPEIHIGYRFFKRKVGADESEGQGGLQEQAHRSDDTGNSPQTASKLKPALIGFSKKERIERKVQDAKDEAVFALIESLAQSTQRNHQLLMHLTEVMSDRSNNAVQTIQPLSTLTENGDAMGRGVKNNVSATAAVAAVAAVARVADDDYELHDKLLAAKELMEFDLNEAQLLRVIASKQ